jgi:hypothetical protein
MNTEYFSVGCEQDYLKGRSANALLPLNTPETVSYTHLTLPTKP